jgi:hypothetical protein
MPGVRASLGALQWVWDTRADGSVTTAMAVWCAAMKCTGSRLGPEGRSMTRLGTFAAGTNTKRKPSRSSGPFGGWEMAADSNSSRTGPEQIRPSGLARRTGDMSDTGSPPAAPDSAYGGRLWPDAAAHAEKSTSRGPGSKNGASTPASRPRRRVLRFAVAAVLAAGAFAAGSGLGVAIGRNSNEPSTLEEAQQRYEEGRSDGFAAGVKAGHAKGYSEGHDKGRSASQKAGRKDGYSDGYRAGKAAGQESGYADGRRDGYHAGVIQGCEAVFDELNTDRVIDRVPGL